MGLDGVLKVMAEFAEHPGLAICGTLIFIYFDMRKRSSNGNGPPTSSQHEKLLDKLDTLVEAVGMVETNRVINYPPSDFAQQVADSHDSVRILREELRPKVNVIDERVRDIHAHIVRVGQ